MSSEKKTERRTCDTCHGTKKVKTAGNPPEEKTCTSCGGKGWRWAVKR